MTDTSITSTAVEALRAEWSQARAVDGTAHSACMYMVQVGDRMIRALELARAALAAPTAEPPSDALNSLENCRLFAARHRKDEWAKTILRFCEEAGVKGSPLRAPTAEPAREGLQLVPVEPTEAMLDAADADPLAGSESGLDEYRAIYRAMLAAAKAEPTSLTGIERRADDLGLHTSASPEVMAQANPDYCRYGVCKPEEPHAPGCTEYTDAELRAAKGRP